MIGKEQGSCQKILMLPFKNRLKFLKVANVDTQQSQKCEAPGEKEAGIPNAANSHPSWGTALRPS